jgi:plastocyanin
MKRRIALAVSMLAVVGVTAAVALAATPVAGTVGPGFTITTAKKTLKAGKYTFTIRDRSSFHNYRLRGPGLNRALTTVSFVGTKRVTVALRRGVYTFLCDPHASSMRGTLRVT